MLQTRQSSKQNNKYEVLHRYHCFSWWWAHSRLKYVEKRNKYTNKNCASSWLYLQDYTGMHSQQIIKFLLCLRVEVLMVVNVKVMVTYDMTLCSSVNMYHHFWRTGLLHHTETTIVSTYSALAIHRFVIVKCSVSSHFCNCQPVHQGIILK